MSQFDPNQMSASNQGIFGLPSDPDNSLIHILPVPWEVTTSYGLGTAKGPSLIRQASEQVDLFDLEIGNTYTAGIYMHPEPSAIEELNRTLKPLALEIVDRLAQGEPPDALAKQIQKINQGSHLMTQWVYQETQKILNKGKLPAILGGDHSVPLGAIKALSEHYKGKIGILHIDAHADLRREYQGFHQSHASIMYNVLNLNPAPQKIVQVGIRDFCQEEYECILDQSGKIKTFFDLHLKRDLSEGQTWNGLCQTIVSELPDLVYISFDIDGLDPALCPNTGTPVPGGLQWSEALYLLYALHKANKKIVGFDLNEVSPGAEEANEWNGNVGARLLYKLCGWMAKTQNLV